MTDPARPWGVRRDPRPAASGWASGRERDDLAEVAMLRHRTGLELGLRRGMSALGVVLGVALVVVSMSHGAPFGVVLGVVTLSFGFLTWRPASSRRPAPERTGRAE